MQAAAGGNHVIHNQDALAVHIVKVFFVNDQGLLAGGGDGLILHDDRIRHVPLDTLAGGDPLLAALAGHFVCQGDALGLGGQDDIKIRALFQQGLGAGNGQLNIAKHDECGNVQVVIDFADGQFTGQACHMQGIGFCHSKQPLFTFRRKGACISPEAMQGCALPAHGSAGASRFGRRRRQRWSQRGSRFRPRQAACTGWRW